MTKEELIERIEGLKNIFGNKCEYVKIDFVIELASELDEPQKPVVPQFVADWYEKNKNNLDYNIWSYVYEWEDQEEDEFKNWFNHSKKAFQIITNMHQFGYTVEKEKRYLVRMKGLSENDCYLRLGRNTNLWWFGMKYNDGSAEHTHKELEQAGFGEIFNSPLFEVEEVEG